MAALNRKTFQNRCRNAIAGVKKDLSNVVKITLDAVDYTPASLTALLQSAIDVTDAAATARATWLLAVQKQSALHIQVLVVLAALQAYVAQNFGSGAVDTQADFGFTPRKKVVMTAAAKASAAAKAKATRALTHPKVAKGTAGNGASASPALAPATTPTNPEPAAPPQAPATPKS